VLLVHLSMIPAHLRTILLAALATAIETEGFRAVGSRQLKMPREAAAAERKIRRYQAAARRISKT
jgi:hypothetical protein